MYDFCIGQLAELLDGQLRLSSLPPLGGEWEPVRRLVTSSRHARPGDVLFALTERDSATACVQEAFAGGALGAVVSGRREEPWAGRFTIEVADAFQSLRRVTDWLRDQAAKSLVSVWGTAGSRVTAHMIHAVLAQQAPGHLITEAAQGPASPWFDVLDLDRAEHGVVELPWPQDRETTCSSVGRILVVTSLSQPGRSEHARDALQAVEYYARCLPEDGLAIFNGEEPELRVLARKLDLPVVWVGRQADCAPRAADVRRTPEYVRWSSEGTHFRLPLPGRQHVPWALAAQAVGMHLGIPTAKIRNALERFQLPPGCGDVQETARGSLIRDIHNGELAAALAGLEVLRDRPTTGRRIVVCAGLKTHTPDAAQQHQHFGEAAVTQCGADMVLAWGPYADEVQAGARQAGMPAERAVAASYSESILATIEQHAAPGDALLFSGARALDCDQLSSVLGTTRRAYAA